MEGVDFKSEKYEKHRAAGKILSETLSEAEGMIEVGTTHLEVAEFAENKIREMGGEPAFPVNISINEEASHSTPSINEKTKFGEDMICLDIGVHVEGWIADAAKTVDLSGNPELVEASEVALEAALDIVQAGVNVGKIGEVIESKIGDRGYNTILNLSGHGVGRYDAHVGPNIPNCAIRTGVELELGDVVAIEPFATLGGGKVTEGGKEEIFSLIQKKSVRGKKSRELIDTIENKYNTLPFAARWIGEGQGKISLQRLKMARIIRGYPILREQKGKLVSQAEHTVIVMEDGCEIITR